MLDGTGPIISEFLAINETILADEDGEYSDWIEIHNPAEAPINLEGWYLTDDAEDLNRWRFPAVELQPNDYLVVFASNKDRGLAGSELHTNFKVDSDGEYLALVQPDGVTVVHAYAPAFPLQYEDTSYGLTEETGNFGIAGGAELTHLVPQDDSLGLNWTAPGFNDASWTSYAELPAILITEGGTGTPDYIEIQNVSQTAIDTTGWVVAANNAASSLINDVHGYLWELSGSVGPGEVLYREDADPDDIFWRASDVGWVLILDDVGSVVDFVIWGYTPAEMALFEVDVNGVQDIHLDGIWLGNSIDSDGAGSNAVQRIGGSDHDNASDWTFDSPGTPDAENVALAVPFVLDMATGVGFDATSTGVGAGVQIDIEDVMHDIGSSLYMRIPFEVTDISAFDSMQLGMKYNDAFVAYINGQEVATRNAPPTPQWDSTATIARNVADSLQTEVIDLTASIGLLQLGTNVLAIHGLNVDLSDGDFLILPALTGKAKRFFPEPTPGAPNTTPGVNYIAADVDFSVDHGFFSSPFALTLSCTTPGVTIHYTTDGSEPTPTNGIEYGSPITIDETTTLRATAFKPNYVPTAVGTRTYIFLDDVKTQAGTPAGWPAGAVNGQVLNYGMDPDIVNNGTWGPQMDAALTAIPSVSLVTDVDNLFGASQGIYVNPYGRGKAWERPASLELIDPSGNEVGFQIDAGVRIRGGYSRWPANPKHAFRLFFRSEYGEGKLDYPLFGEEGVDKFDNIDLRSAQNYSWHFGGDTRNAFVRDVFSRDTQRDMGQPYTRSRYYHLYINGQYWGLFQSQERSEASFGSSYLGGTADEYDVIKVDVTAGYTIEATDGNMNAWTDLWNQARDVATGGSDPARHEAYMKLQGLDPDGTRNPAYDVLLDVDNLIDYMLVIFYGGNLDAPVSWFIGNTNPNNWYGMRNRNGEEGFRFFAHDSEHTLSVVGINQDRTGPFPAGSTLATSNPQWIHQELSSHAEYRMQFADRVQKHFFNGGVLTPGVAAARLQARADEIDMAIIAESARWGDAWLHPPRTKSTWLTAIAAETGWFIPLRSDVVLDQLRNKNLFPSVEAPTFNLHGGEVQPGFALGMTAPAGTIWYTTDGSDPRGPGAIQFDAAITETPLVSSGANWRYRDDGSDQGTPWYAPGFNDNPWNSGPAQLGYGDGDEATAIEYGGDPLNKYTTTYFRRSFNVSNPTQFTGMKLRLLCDDGAIVYLNGQEIVRDNMPLGNVDYQTFASSFAAPPAENEFAEYYFDPALLIDGPNVLAVEVHQASLGSSDVSFDLELIGNDGPALQSSTVVKARALNGVWSAMTEADFFVGNAAGIGNLVLSEINYNPYDPTPEEFAAGFDENNDFEFIELVNTAGVTIDLAGAQFTNGIDYQFRVGDVQPLEPGQFAVLPKNWDAFVYRYGNVENLVDGEYDEKLSNGGEQITLVDRYGQTIFDFIYGDSRNAGWPNRADSNGPSLELIDPIAVPGTEPARATYLQDSDNWRSSSEFLGNPGVIGLGPYTDVVINEVLTHTDYPLVDAIELYNPTGTAVVLDGWWLSDDNDDFFKFQIPVGTTIPAYGYETFYEGHYQGQVFAVDQATEFGGLDPNDPKDFALNGTREDDVWLLADFGDGSSLRFADHVEFGGALQGESFGRWPDAAGDLYPMQSLTLDGANSGPRLPTEVVISEVMYNSPGVAVPDELEFVEVFNVADYPIDLTGWRLRKGFDFDFVPGTVLDVGSALVVAAFDPSDPAKLDAFRVAYGIGPEVAIFGTDLDSLDDVGERIQLQRPDDPEPDDPLFIPHVIEDEVNYSNTWKPSTDDGGDSLNRIAATAWGNDPASWSAEVPTPGEATALQTSGVAGRYVFYNNSSLGNTIAPDKTALQPGGQASFANYTSYVHGINGIIIDIVGVLIPGEIDAGDFTFKLGNDDTPGNWTDAPAPASIDATVNQITLTWNDGAIRNTWLEVTVLANGGTGLSFPDVFYFGSAPGETGNSLTDATVDAIDVLATRQNPQPFFDPAAIDNVYDFNRDRRVNAIDTLIARNHQTWAGTELALIDLTAQAAVVESKARNAGPYSPMDGAQPLNDALLNEKLDWLYQLEPAKNDSHAHNSTPAKRAIDKLLEIDGV